MTKANIVHALATAAVLVMGEGAESVPIVIIRDADVERDPDASGEVSDLAILPREDVYRVVFE
jgi:F420-0:gamma-glutamyl ligase